MKGPASYGPFCDVAKLRIRKANHFELDFPLYDYFSYLNAKRHNWNFKLSLKLLLGKYYTTIDFHGGEYTVTLTPIFMILPDLGRAISL